LLSAQLGHHLVESLYLGVPFHHPGRASQRRSHRQLHPLRLGHPEWIAQSESEYIDKAVALAGDLERLATIRANLRPEFEASPWRDEVGFARRVEQAYRQMWRQWCEAQRPRPCILGGEQ
jgi:Predicted O-linked N-acetylglucosamine transferase, SPINDLY family